MCCCSPVCGLWSSWLGKGHCLHFFSQYCASHPLPTTCVWIQGGASCPSRPNNTIIARLVRLFIHQLSLSQTMWVCWEQGSSLLFLTPFSLLSTHRLSADVARGRSGPWLLGPYVCVCACVCHLPLLTPWRCVIGGICVCLCLPVQLDAGGNRMREDQL